MTIPWTVSREWAGETVAILASGPSMCAEQAQQLQGKCRVIAVNNQGIPTLVNGALCPAFAPWADILYAADATWWRKNPEALNFAGRKVTIRPENPVDEKRLPTVYSLQNGGCSGFDDRPTHIRTGGNSGYQALHLAAHLGVKRALLLGFDMRPAPDGQEHWFGSHPWRRGFKSRYDIFIIRFEKAAHEFAQRGIEVVNCTSGSALKCFPHHDVERALCLA